MVDKIVEKALLDAPLNSSFFFIDLRDFPLPDRNQILKRFYDGLILTNFPFPDELDPLEVWEKMFTPGDEFYDFTIMHILLAFDKKDTKLETILGGNVLEYYPQSKCSLLSFIVVDSSVRQKGLGKTLVDLGYNLMNREAKERDGLEECHAYFAETNMPEFVSAEEDSMPPRLRVDVLQRMGFQRCIFDFVQPPLAPDQKPFKNLYLCVYVRDNNLDKTIPTTSELNLIPSSFQHLATQSLPYVEAKDLEKFLGEYWESCDAEPEDYTDWHDTVKQLRENPRIFVVPLVEPNSSTPTPHSNI